MSSTNRHHTVVVSTDENGANSFVLEKDWYSYQWCVSFDRRMIVESRVGRFHIVGQRFVFSPADAEKLVAQIIAGKIQTIDLRALSVKHFPTAEERRWKK